ncbi:FTR1 family protein [Paenibacillus sp. MMS20-IR301]|uniref:FTR1 family iron permease n=1 Tax=Paenibacillus sp. MMS20-IR301 TaxID=2895946 RepID=UPI0028EDE235|nr:FTR1 family protein [Paenibacillus sp. MMS20-IR301]WNS40687.1 FTR1 family protein [Paenibacillus sp. MMS20-IR301]
MRRQLWSKGLVIILLLLWIMPGQAQAADANWRKVVDQIEDTLQQALKTYEQGDLTEAKNQVNDAYYGPYESGQMEKAVKFSISSKRNAIIEEEFRLIRKSMTAGASKAEVKQQMAELVDMLREDAAALSKSSSSPWGIFLSSLVIILREGIEAILVIAAIIAYLIKSGNAQKVRIIYQSTLVALGASVLTAIGLKYLFNISGASQENLEGITMLIAVAVLFSMSFWLIGKADAKRWKNYIEGKIQTSLTTGNTMTLWFAAFLAVYREGAETVLFYQALVSGQDSAGISMIGLGFLAGAVALVAVFLIIRYGSLRIPLKPFFIGTSILMYYLAFVFAGEAVTELQAGMMVSATSIFGFPVISFFGIYPTVESLAAQGLLLLATAIGLIWYAISGRKAAASTAGGHTAG